MSAVDIAQIVLAVFAVIGAAAAVAAWFYKRGGQERALSDALDRNTRANNEVATKLEEFRSVVIEMFHGLDKRVTRLEDRP